MLSLNVRHSAQQGAVFFLPFTTQFHNAIIKITFFSKDQKDTQRIYKGYTVRVLYYQGGRKNGLQRVTGGR